MLGWPSPAQLGSAAGAGARRACASVKPCVAPAGGCVSKNVTAHTSKRRSAGAMGAVGRLSQASGENNPKRDKPALTKPKVARCSPSKHAAGSHTPQPQVAACARIRAVQAGREARCKGKLNAAFRGEGSN